MAAAPHQDLWGFEVDTPVPDCLIDIRTRAERESSALGEANGQDACATGTAPAQQPARPRGPLVRAERGPRAAAGTACAAASRRLRSAVASVVIGACACVEAARPVRVGSRGGGPK